MNNEPTCRERAERLVTEARHGDGIVSAEDLFDLHVVASFRLMLAAATDDAEMWKDGTGGVGFTLAAFAQKPESPFAQEA